MVTNELIEYIKEEIENGISREGIISSLIEAGWYKEDIDEGFLNIEKIKNTEIKKQVDLYRELPDEDGDPLALTMSIEELYKPIKQNSINNSVSEDIVKKTYNPEAPLIYNPADGTFTAEKIIISKPIEVVPVVEASVVSTPTPISEPIIETHVSSPKIIEEPIIFNPVEGTLPVEKSIISKPVEETSPVIETPVVSSPIINEPVIESPVLEIKKIEEPIEVVPVVEAPVVSTPTVISEPIIETHVSSPKIIEEPIIFNPIDESPKIEGIINTETNTPVIEIPKINIAPVEKAQSVNIILPEEVHIAPVINNAVENPVIKTETEIISEIKTAIEYPKIWVPNTIKPIVSNIEEKPQIKEENKNVELDKNQSGFILPKIDYSINEVKAIETPVIEKTKEQTPKIEIKKVETPIVTVTPTKTTSVDSSFDIIPPAKKDFVSKDFIPVINKTAYSFDINTKKISEVATNSAMISSYKQDILSSVKKDDSAVLTSGKKNWPLKIGIIILILSLIGGMLFAFVEGYIKIPGAKASFFVVKKEPKVIVLGASSTLSKLKSYKTETKINISSPSFSNITAGLSSGDVINSKDRESISISVKGLINNEDKKISDYIFDIESSILRNKISTNIKSDGVNLYMTIPDLSPILGEDTPEPTTISLEREQIGLVINELSPETQTLIKKIDIYNILSNKAPDYVTNEMSFILKDFIETFEYVDKGDEKIHGVDASHYGVNITRASTKKLLGSISSLFFSQINDEEKKVLDEAIGASSISSFEVWVGKDDDNLYQVKFTLNAPLSKVLGLNDSGIAGNEVKLDWITTFYDLDVENKINIPKGEVDVDSFVKNIRNIKIKNIMSSFKSQATIFKNAVGSYGKKTNSSGSCMMPVTGSMFSPLGHNKGADGAVGTISTTMNSLLLITKEEGFCYSTPSAWALIVPLLTEPISYYCADSEGNKTTIISPVSETSCVSTE